jgi:hypothetical protein
MKALAPFILLSSFAIHAEACSCVARPPVSVALAKSDFVIHGRCISFAIHSEDTRTARFEVTRSFKGLPEKKIIDVATSINGASCGYGFVAGDYYLVYGYADNGSLSTSICTRTKELHLSHVEDDAEYVALGMMIGAPAESWTGFDPSQGARDPFIKPNPKE